MAVLLVIWAHVPAGLFGPTAELIKKTAQAGYLGVDIFFVLSGFLITRILLVDRAEGRPLRHFLARRLLRIFPIYYLTLAVLAIVQDGPELPWCALYLANVYFPFHPVDSMLRHTWSLSVEEHYYLIWPACVYLLSSRASRLVLWFGFLPLALGGAALVISAMDIGPLRQVIESALDSGQIKSWQPKLLIYQFTAFRASSLAVGSLFAFSELALRRRPGRTMAVCVLVFLAGRALIQLGLRRFGLDWFPLTQLVANNLISGSVVLGVICLGDLGGLATRLLDNPPLRYIGRISYGVYLYHYPIFHALGVRAGAEELGPKLALALALSFGTAALSFALLEKPLLRYANRFRGAKAAA